MACPTTCEQHAYQDADIPNNDRHVGMWLFDENKPSSWYDTSSYCTVGFTGLSIQIARFHGQSRRGAYCGRDKYACVGTLAKRGLMCEGGRMDGILRYIRGNVHKILMHLGCETIILLRPLVKMPSGRNKHPHIAIGVYFKIWHWKWSSFLRI